MSKENHFFIKDVSNRLPTELLPKNASWSALLSAITQLKTERNNALERVADMQEIVEAVAHIGVDFGYGKFELSDEHINKARELIATGAAE